MMNLVKVDVSSFCGVFTAYELEGKWRESGQGSPTSRLVRAEIRSANEVAPGNDNRVFFTYEHEAHALTLQEVADIFINVDRAIIGKSDRNTRVVCLLPKLKICEAKRK